MKRRLAAAHQGSPIAYAEGKAAIIAHWTRLAKEGAETCDRR